ncbi:MAG: LemA family protein [Methanobrevibacter thaueri]|uniref:LemA family protein n=1 Tax=Methanobrevibacter thaueri TaxID=190975 RepID=A0A8T3VIL3_9EURY|nr:LemA family protein [Methanobrevibacter thaueri]MBE6502518.1 LemA family protein [Methanobrevibacter thaueri]
MSLLLTIVIIVCLIIIIGTLIHMYNNLVGLRNRVKNSYAQIDVQLKRRNDLIPNLVETVKGYAGHEKGVLEEVTKARTGVMNASTVEEASAADNQLTGALKTLFAVAENYPDLKANSNFQQLQNELSDTEDKISYARQFYNDVVLKYNNACQQFPSSLMARLFGFKEETFFEAPESEREVPKVEF